LLSVSAIAANILQQIDGAVLTPLLAQNSDQVPNAVPLIADRQDLLVSELEDLKQKVLDLLFSDGLKTHYRLDEAG
jgi:hypothetical protein